MPCEIAYAKQAEQMAAGRTVPPVMGFELRQWALLEQGLPTDEVLRSFRRRGLVLWGQELRLRPGSPGILNCDRFGQMSKQSMRRADGRESGAEKSDQAI